MISKYEHNHILNNPFQSAGESTFTHLGGATILKPDTDWMVMKSDVS